MTLLITNNPKKLIVFWMSPLFFLDSMYSTTPLFKIASTNEGDETEEGVQMLDLRYSWTFVFNNMIFLVWHLLAADV